MSLSRISPFVGNSSKQTMPASAWDTTYQKTLAGVDNQEQTALFFEFKRTDPNFESLREKQKKEFQSSTNQIIEFGIGIGKYFSKTFAFATRRVIGYDYSPIAIKHIQQNGMEGRLINLNEIKNKSSLAYQPQLEKDFSAPSDVLFIRTIEYLAPEAARLLVFSVLDLAQPGTRFYFEIFNSSKKDKIDETNKITITHYVKPRYIASFFAPRTDIQFLMHAIIENENRDKNCGNNTKSEQFVVEKIRR